MAYEPEAAKYQGSGSITLPAVSAADQTRAHAGAATEREVAAADAGMAADMRLRFNHDHLRTGLLGDDGVGAI
jgi:hypothetical protein